MHDPDMGRERNKCDYLQYAAKYVTCGQGHFHSAICSSKNMNRGLQTVTVDLKQNSCQVSFYPA